MIEIFADRKEILESLSPLTGANQIVALIAKCALFHMKRIKIVEK